MAYSSKNKLKNIFNSTKDKIPSAQRSGTYKAECGTEKCNMVYIRETRRCTAIRFKEHLAEIRLKRTEKSGLCEHIIDNNHKIELNNFSLLHEEVGFNKLDVTETMYINKYSRRTMNRNNGFEHSSLFDLCKKE